MAAKKHAPVPEAPQTIRQNWIPFLTFFLRRSLMAEVEVDMLDAEYTREDAILSAVLGWFDGGGRLFRRYQQLMV